MPINKIFKTLGRLCVIGVILLGPWRNAGQEPEYIRVLLYLIWSAGILALISLWTLPRNERCKNAYAPMLVASFPLLLGLAISIFQILPLPDSVLKCVSPHTLALRTFLGVQSTSDVSDLDELEIFAKEPDSSYFPQEISIEELKKAIISDSKISNEIVLPSISSRNNHCVWGNTISVYPLITRERLPLFIAAFIFFCATALLFNTVSSRQFLLKFITVFSCIYAILCISLRAHPSWVETALFDKLLLIKVSDDGSFGTFFSKNAGGGYLVLGLGASLYWLSREFLINVKRLEHERYERKKEQLLLVKQSGEVYEIKTSPKWKIVLGDFFDLFNRRFATRVCVTGFLFSTIYMSYSRGAAVAATVSLCSVCLLLGMRRDVWRYWSVLVLIFIVAALAISGAGMSQRVDDRMSTLIDENSNGETAIDTDSRWDNWEDAAKTSKEYPWFGSGLGTYSIANARNDRALIEHSIFRFAENVYVQTRLEMGFWGLVALIAEYVALLLLAGRFCIGKHSIETNAIAIGAIATTLGQATAAFADYGNYLPANMLLFATLCGLYLARQNKNIWDNLQVTVHNRKNKEHIFQKMTILRRREFFGAVICTVMLLGVLCSFRWVFLENADYIHRYRALEETKDLSADQLAFMSEHSLDRSIERLEKLMSRRNDSYEICFELAKLKLARFRLKLIGNLKLVHSDIDEKTLWGETDPSSLTDTLLHYQKMGFEVPVASIRDREDVKTYLPETLVALYNAKAICPLFQGCYSGLCQIFPLVLDLDWQTERRLIELYAHRARFVAQYDVSTLFLAGYYLGCVGNTELQNRFWRWTLECNQGWTNKVFTLLAIKTPPKYLRDYVEEVVSDDPGTIGGIVSQIGSWKQSPVYDVVIAKANRVFEQIPEEARDVSYYRGLAHLYSIAGNYESADDCYKKALELKPSDPQLFWTRVNFLCAHTSELQRDDECIRLIDDHIRQFSMVGQLRCEELRKRAEDNKKRNKVRADIKLKIQRENEMTERVKTSLEAGSDLTNDKILQQQTEQNNPIPAPDFEAFPEALEVEE